VDRDERLPVFQLHIQPMFRLLDREHMLTLFGPGVDLWDLDAVWQLRNKILVRLRLETDSNMPGLDVGGPWPPEWIDLFERWTQNPTEDDIGHHLVLASTAGPYRLEAVSTERRLLRATVLAPSPGCRAWLSLDSVTPGQRAYTTYLEPAMPAQPAAETNLEIAEEFVKGGATTVLVRDAGGSHQLTLP
jgi:hypothetical protein